MNIIGIPNIRNTCFLNASLQTLIYNEKLYKILLEAMAENKKNDLITYFTIMQRICIEAKNINMETYMILIKKLYENLIKNSHFEFGEQEDASDCIGFFIDFFHESIKQEVVMTLKNTNCSVFEKESFDSWVKFYKKSYSPIIKYFYGQFGSILTCSNCHKTLNNFEPFNILSLPVNEEHNNVIDCLNTFCNSEKIDDYKCESCKEKCEFSKQISFFILPYFLNISLKNINYQNSKKQKINIEEQLEFTDYTWNKYPIKYSLNAIVYHHGSLNNGHYYACRKFNDNYYLFDDTKVKQIESFPDYNASILCYERVK